VRLQAPAGSARRQVKAYGELLRNTVLPKTAVALLHAFHMIDVRKYVSDICCPTLIVQNRHNAIVPFR
jgi:hypothetical protein